MEGLKLHTLTYIKNKKIHAHIDKKNKKDTIKVTLVQ